MTKELSSIAKEILSTCVSIGSTIDGKDPKDLQEEITDIDLGKENEARDENGPGREIRHLCNGAGRDRSQQASYRRACSSL
ncbi:hypothetical protein Ahy_B03g063486 [Arachis hypogaea]|uniref:Ribosomal protein L11 C-terminal domain-containing protein n=1 Tax=Arachis hypogaea TaxID=3818 RepID=A0A444ZXX1_ARAHY|nr:hypothetical protein Ahy_B03g063486 [Arachis hypogaea]